MWWRLSVLAAASVGLVVLLFLPAQSVDIVVEMPRGRGDGSMSADQMETMLTGVTAAVTIALLVGYAVLVLWVARFVVRKIRARPQG